ncbi:MAG TPA: class I SAM-dependent methyltransferase [Ignavibacteriales bacterium]|nr:class I SAM-dependent methyltransferase [Ignavibacteriales bacterium]
MPKKTGAKEFYDEAASFYDEMISFEKALENRKILLNKFITGGIKSCADFGCGSGADAIALASYNLDVTGFDVSRGMIEAAKSNAASRNVNAEFRRIALEKIGPAYKNKFDLVISTGNSLANIESSKLSKALKSAFASLHLNGRFILQILNYNRILNSKERIVNINKQGENYFIRFYDFEKNGLTFNILKFNAADTKNRKLITSRIYPYKKEDMVAALKKAGFSRIKAYGDLNLNKFSRNNSPDLVISAIKTDKY